MTRRRYPILGRRNLRLIDATQTPLKPVYLRYRILEVGLEDQSRASRPWIWILDLDPGSGSQTRDLDPSISDLRIYLNIRLIRPFDWIYLRIP